MTKVYCGRGNLKTVYAACADPFGLSGLKVHLVGEDAIGEDPQAGAVGDEVGDGLHDVPGVHPPGEPGQRPALHRQQGHAPPQGPGGLGLGLEGQFSLHLNGQEYMVVSRDLDLVFNGIRVQSIEPTWTRNETLKHK